MFFPKFPSTKLQDVNLDWILKKISALRGGTTNQVLAKASDADFDFKWITGGGGGGTSDYNDLVNQPQINNVTLVGNKSASDLGLLDPAALAAYRTAAAQDAIDAAKQTKITASGLLKGDGDGGVSAATPGTDYIGSAALTPYRTAAAQDTIDAAQNADIASRAKADEIGIVIIGSRPSAAVSIGQYVIVRSSTISGVTDGLYTAVNALSPSTDVSAADLTAVTIGGLNELIKITSAHPSNIYLIKTGRVVQLYFAIYGIDLVDGFNVIATIPAKYVPYASTFDLFGTNMTSTKFYRMNITSNHELRIYAHGSETGAYIVGNTTYITN